MVQGLWIKDKSQGFGLSAYSTPPAGLGLTVSKAAAVGEV